MSQAVVIIDLATAELDSFSEIKLVNPTVKVVIPERRKTVPLSIVELAKTLKGDIEFIRVKTPGPRISDAHFLSLLGAFVGDSNGGNLFIISCRKALGRMIFDQGLHTRLSKFASKIHLLESYPLQSPRWFGREKSYPMTHSQNSANVVTARPARFSSLHAGLQ